MKIKLHSLLAVGTLLISCATSVAQADVQKGMELSEKQENSFNNPIIKDKYTADAAALVYDDTVYLYAGHDQAADNEERYIMNEWLVYSSNDMVNWKEHPVPLKPSDLNGQRGCMGGSGNRA